MFGYWSLLLVLHGQKQVVKQLPKNDSTINQYVTLIKNTEPCDGNQGSMKKQSGDPTQGRQAALSGHGPEHQRLLQAILTVKSLKARLREPRLRAMRAALG